jgi:hypothetical protein
MQTAVMLAALPVAVNAPKGYLNVDSGDFSGPLQWILLLAALGGVVRLTNWFAKKTRTERAQKRQQSARQGSESQAFQERALHLGLRPGEARTVERIAQTLAPKSPLNLLNSSQGREFLMADLEKRIVRREREIKVLGRIKLRFEALRSSDVHEREWVRVDANIAVWVSKQGLTGQEMTTGGGRGRRRERGPVRQSRFGFRTPARPQRGGRRHRHRNGCGARRPGAVLVW